MVHVSSNVFILGKREKLLRDELYVMLMLQRSDEGGATVDEGTKLLACVEKCGSDADCLSKCYAEEKDNEKEDTVVKSGDLAIKATPSTNRKAVATGISDLDTITLKASEAITLDSVTLERYGYSDGAKVVNVWLEDEDGTIITTKKGLNKDKVTLTLKKDYKELDSTDTFTIVVELNGAEGDIGFKVVDVEASAKNLDLSDYDPYTYQIVVYEGATITLTQKGKANVYNYEEGSSYEMQRFKAKAETSAITVYGFTLKSDTAVTTVDLQDGVKDVEVTVNGEAVKGLKWDINSKKELKINFDEVEIPNRESATFAVNFVFVNGFEDLGRVIKLDLAKTDFNAVEKKTGSRVTVENALVGYTQTINGGKITLENVKLGTVEAGPETDDVVFGEGKISVAGQNLVLNGFTLTFTTINHSDKAITDDDTAAGKGKYPAVADVRMVINGDENTAKCVSTSNLATWGADTPSGFTANYTTTCTFDTVDIDKDSTIKFMTNLTKYAKGTTTITLSAGSYGKALITNTGSVGIYDDANKPILDANFIGTIDLNQIKVQTPRASIETSDLKTVQFVQGKSDTQTIFKGTYLAKNKDIYLNSFSAESTSDVTAQLAKFDQLTLKVFVNGKEVATPDVKVNAGGNRLVAADDFSRVLVKQGEKVDIEVKAQAYPNKTTTASIEFNVTFNGEDSDGNPAGEATEVATQFKVVEKGAVTVSDSAYSESNKEFQNNSVSLKKSGATLAKFDLKASNSNANIDLENFCFTVSRDTTPITTTNEIKVKVAGKTVDDLSYATCPDGSAGFVVSDLNEPLESNGVNVEISSKGNPVGSEYVVTLVNVNSDSKNVNKVYKQYILPVKVTFTQQDLKGSTKFTAKMDNGDNDVEINNIQFIKTEPTTPFAPNIAITSISEGSDGSVEAAGIAGVQLVNGIIITTDEVVSAGTPAVAAEYTFVPDTTDTSTIANVATADVVIPDTTNLADQVTAINGAAGALYTASDNGDGKIKLVAKTAGAVTAPTSTYASAAVTEVVKGKDAVATVYKTYSILKSVYNDYFKVGDTYLKVFDKDTK